MPLTFPTMAEQCEAAFRNAARTVSIATIARRMGAERNRVYPVTWYTFDDDTTLEVIGVGRAHKVTTYLP